MPTHRTDLANVVLNRRRAWRRATIPMKESMARMARRMYLQAESMGFMGSVLSSSAVCPCARPKMDAVC